MNAHKSTLPFALSLVVLAPLLLLSGCAETEHASETDSAFGTNPSWRISATRADAWSVEVDSLSGKLPQTMDVEGKDLNGKPQSISIRQSGGKTKYEFRGIAFVESELESSGLRINIDGPTAVNLHNKLYNVLRREHPEKFLDEEMFFADALTCGRSNSGYTSCSIDLRAETTLLVKGNTFSFGAHDHWQWGTADMKSKPYTDYLDQVTTGLIYTTTKGDLSLAFVENRTNGFKSTRAMFKHGFVAASYDGRSLRFQLDAESSVPVKNSLLGGRARATKMAYGRAFIDCSAFDGRCTITAPSQP